MQLSMHVTIAIKHGIACHTSVTACTCIYTLNTDTIQGGLKFMWNDMQVAISN